MCVCGCAIRPGQALNKALRQGKLNIHHNDQGGQYAAHAYIQRLRAVQAQISMADAGKATDNASLSG